MRMLLGVFGEEDNAEQAIKKLERTGFKTQDISIMMRDKEAAREMADNTGSNVAGSAASGATTGGIIGAVAGLLVGVGAIAVPGVGALLIGGPIAAALGLTGAAASTVSGAVTGVLAGGLVGALVGLGVPEDEARVYEESIKKGGILVAVPTEGYDEDEAREIMESYGADQIRSVSGKRSETPVPREERNPAYFSEVDRNKTDLDLDEDLD
jgi:hypothetical protein